VHERSSNTLFLEDFTAILQIGR